MKTQKSYNPAVIETVGDAIEFCSQPPKCIDKRLALEFFKQFRRNKKIKNLKNIPDEDWVIEYVTLYPTQYNISRFRRRIWSSFYALEWAKTFRGEEIDRMRSKVRDELIALEWAKTFRGEEINRMRSKIQSPYTAYEWAKTFRGAEIDRMLRKRAVILDDYFKNKIRRLYGKN